VEIFNADLGVEDMAAGSPIVPIRKSPPYLCEYANWQHGSNLPHLACRKKNAEKSFPDFYNYKKNSATGMWEPYNVWKAREDRDAASKKGKEARAILPSLSSQNQSTRRLRLL